jgi:twitching motility two-component system response regulator PilG
MKVEQEVAAVTKPLSVNESTAGGNNSPASQNGVRVEVVRLVREGITAAKAGNLAAAREFLQDAVHADPYHETALMWLASISDKPQELLGYLQRVLAINPSNERASQWAKATKSLLAKSLIQQGAAAHKEGMPEIASQYFLQATEHEPTNETAWLWLVSVAAEPEDKLSYLNRVLNLNPAHEKALALFHKTKTQIARSLVKKANAAALAGDKATAREILGDVMEYNPNLEEAWLLKAFLADAVAEKIQAFEQALDINPNSEQAQSGLAALKFVEQKAEEPAPAPVIEEMPEAPAFEDAPLPLPQEFSGETLVDDEGEEQGFVADRYVPVNEQVDETSVVEELSAQTAAPVKEEILETQPQVAAPAPFVEEEILESPIVVDNTPQAKVACRFCRYENFERDFRCRGCGAVVTLGHFAQTLSNELNDEQGMFNFIEALQSKAAGSELSAEEYFNLGLAYLNLRNAKKAVGNFEQVLALEPDNQKYSEQITAFFEYLKEKMPEVLGSNVSHTGKTIMVVDDSPTVRKLIMGKLEKHGHRVIAAVDGMDALSKINEDVPDLILLDVTMPRLDGYQLCKLVKNNAKTKHVPVVMISGKDGFFDKVRGRMAGSTAYITKPFGPETLLQTVDTYCG